MLRKLLFIFIAAFFCTAFFIPERIVKRADKEIVKFYEIENFSKENYRFPEGTNEFTLSEFGEENLFKITSEGKFLGNGYIGNAPSKTATYDYLVLFDKDFIITKSKVLLYREDYGGEIGSKRWLMQFVGASSDSAELVYNENIIPISGATISVKSMTKAINNLLKSINFLQDSNLL